MELPSCGDDRQDVVASSRVGVTNGPCMRCATPKSYTLSRQRLLCRPCFVEAAQHHFRKTLHPVRPIDRKKRSPVVVAVSGGLHSVSMARLMEQCFFEQDPRKSRHECHMAWVDCSDVLPGSQDHKQHVQSLIMGEDESTKKKGWASVSRIPLYRSLHPLLSACPLADDSEEARVLQRRLIDLFSSGSRNTAPSRSLTWRRLLLRCLIMRLLVDHCSRLQCHILALGSNMDVLSVHLFSMLARGVGRSAAPQSAACDPWTLSARDIIVVRPMAAMTASEVALYARAVGLLQAGQRSWPMDLTHGKTAPMVGGGVVVDDVWGLTEDFLVSLQTQHDHTMPTLMKTASKMDVSHLKMALEWSKCAGCDAGAKATIAKQGPIEDVPCALCFAVLVEKKSSKGGKSCDNGKTECGCNEGGGGCGDTNKGPLLDAQDLCRSCQLMLEEIEGANGTKPQMLFSLPDNRTKMRERIADCLLSDDEQ